MNGNGKVTYHQQVSYCGKPRCRKCREGKGHGPYWYAYQTVNGHTTRTYIGKNLPPEAQASQDVISLNSVGIAATKLPPLVIDFSTVAVRIFALGQFRIERRQQRQWQSVTDLLWQQQQVRALLAYLICCPQRRASRAQVITALWPDSDEETASSNLDRVVRSLRQVLESSREASQSGGRVRPSRTSGQLVHIEGEWLALADQSRVWVDADAFIALSSRVEEAGNSEQTEQAEQNQEGLLQEAIALYGGDFLPEERRASWVLSLRQSLRRRWCSLLLDLTDIYIAQKETTDALEVLDRLLPADPANEKAVQRLMYVLGGLTRRGEALRAYHRLADLLQNEYHTQPSQETRALYEAIRQGKTLSSYIQLAPIPPKGEPKPKRPPAPEQAASPVRVSSTVPFKAVDPGMMQIGRTHQNPLVGREMELETLRGVVLDIEQSARLQLANQRRLSGLPLDTQRRPQCAVLLGEAGIGKTRLAEEISRELAGKNWSILWSRVYPQESGIPYHIWREVLRRSVVSAGLVPSRVPARRTTYAEASTLNPTQETIQQIWQQSEQDLKPGSRRGERGRKSHTGAEQPLPLQLQPLVALLPELEALFPQVAPPPLTPEQEQLRLWEAIRDLLIAASEITPLLIVLDDIQWADGSSSDLLGYLARHIYGHPILLLATCRDTELPTQPPHPLRTLVAHMQREHTVHTLQINPLTTEEIRRLVAHLPEAMVQHIQEQAAGNPFFAEELARSTPPTLPRSVAAALDHRMGRLSGSCQQLLGNAAVLGGSFEFPLIAAMEADRATADEDMVLDLLEEALQSGVLTEEGTGTRVTYHFWHPLLVSHLYESVSGIRRSRLHLRAATILQHMHQGRIEEVAATITHHLIKGGAESSRIAHYAEIAGDRAYTFSAYAEAEYHYRLTLDHLGISMASMPGNGNGRHTTPVSRDPHVLNLLELLAECTMIRGKFTEARHLYEYILQLRSPLENASAYEVQKQALLWGEIAWTWRYTGDNARARECCQRGEQVLLEAAIVAGPAWARLRLQQGSLYWQEGRYEEARTAAQESLALFAQQQKPAASLSITDTTPSASSVSPVNPLRTTRIQRTLDGDPVDMGADHRLLGALAEAEGRLSDALDHLNTALVIFEQADHQRRIAHVSQDISYVCIKKAQLELAQAALRRAYSIAERIGDDPLIGVITSNLAELSAISGKLEEAESLYKGSLVLAERIHDREYISWWNARLSAVLREQNKLAEAEECVKRALRIARAMRNNPRLGTALLALGNLRIAQAQSAERLPVVRKRLLEHARQDIARALALPGLEAETRIKAHLAEAQISLLLGEAPARQHIEQVIEEAHRCELALVEANARDLLAKV
jgi:DNA-binding SARP family transcriptional activator/Flp pilus assembly protein TadD